MKYLRNEEKEYLARLTEAENIYETTWKEERRRKIDDTDGNDNGI